MASPTSSAVRALLASSVEYSRRARSVIFDLRTRSTARGVWVPRRLDGLADGTGCDLLPRTGGQPLLSCELVNCDTNPRRELRAGAVDWFNW